MLCQFIHYNLFKLELNVFKTQQIFSAPQVINYITIGSNILSSDIFSFLAN